MKRFSVFALTSISTAALFLGLNQSCMQKKSKSQPARESKEPIPSGSPQPVPTVSPTSTATLTPTGPGLNLTVSLPPNSFLTIYPSYAVVSQTSAVGTAQLLVYSKTLGTFENLAFTSAINLFQITSISNKANYTRRSELFLRRYSGSTSITSRTSDQQQVSSTTTSDGTLDLSFTDTTQKDTAPNTDQAARVIPVSVQASGGGAYEALDQNVLFGIPSTGVSIIVDVENTLKTAPILLKNDFIKSLLNEDYVANSAITSTVRDTANQCKAAMHYVSNAPDQLASELWAFIKAQSLPLGSLSMQKLRADPTVLFTNFSTSANTRATAIEKILRDFPQRRFILVSNLTGQNPETFGGLAKRFTNVKRIYFHSSEPYTTEIANRINTAKQGSAAEVAFVGDQVAPISCP